MPGSVVGTPAAAPIVPVVMAMVAAGPGVGVRNGISGRGVGLGLSHVPEGREVFRQVLFYDWSNDVSSEAFNNGRSS